MRRSRRRRSRRSTTVFRGWVAGLQDHSSEPGSWTPLICACTRHRARGVVGREARAGLDARLRNSRSAVMSATAACSRAWARPWVSGCRKRSARVASPSRAASRRAGRPSRARRSWARARRSVSPRSTVQAASTRSYCTSRPQAARNAATARRPRAEARYGEFAAQAAKASARAFIGGPGGDPLFMRSVGWAWEGVSSTVAERTPRLGDRAAVPEPDDGFGALPDGVVASADFVDVRARSFAGLREDGLRLSLHGDGCGGFLAAGGGGALGLFASRGLGACAVENLGILKTHLDEISFLKTASNTHFAAQNRLRSACRSHQAGRKACYGASS